MLSLPVLWCWLRSCFFFLCNVAAIPVSEYQQNLKNAVAALEALYEMDEEDAEYDAKFRQAIEGIRTTLPQQPEC